MATTTFSFMPIAASRTRIEPGEYRATCTAVRQPELYRAYNRWYLRVDFAIHETGEVVSRYLNLGTGEQANLQLSTRSDYYKLWIAAVGRKPDKNEPMDPSKIVGIEFLVIVADKEHRTDGVYSRVESIRKEVVAAVATEALCSVTTGLQGYKSTDATGLHLSEATHATSPTTAQALQLQAEDSQVDCSPTPEELSQLERTNKLRRIQNNPELTLEELRLRTRQMEQPAA